MRGQRAAAVGAVVLAVALAVAGCSDGGATARTTAGSSVGKVSPVIQLDASKWSTITTLAASSSSPGVWLWTTSADDSRVWNFDPAKGTTNSWSLGTDPALRGGAALPALAACDSGVWLGINHDLVHLDPTTGAVQHNVVPTTAPVAAVDAHRPPQLQGLSAVNAVACSKNDVALGLADATNAFVYHLSSGLFDAVELPDSTEVVSVAITQPGEIAFGLQDYAQAKPHSVLLIGGPRGRRVVEVSDSTHVGASGPSVVAGARAQPIDPDTATTGKALSPLLASDVIPTLGSFPMPDGSVLVATTGGLRIADPAGAKPARDISLGAVPCLERTGPAGSATAAAPGVGAANGSSSSPTSGPTRLCAIQARAIAVDSAGNVFVSLSNDSVVAQVSF